LFTIETIGPTDKSSCFEMWEGVQALYGMCARSGMTAELLGEVSPVLDHDTFERALKLLVGSHGSITIAMAEEQPQPAAGPPGTTA
jgi:hypothetical protein